METNIKQISTALVKAQSEMSNAKKGSSNPFFKSKYADLNSIREASIPVLNAHGISVLQPIVHIDGKNFVKTILLHESGESLDSHTEIVYSKSNDAQAQGSGISYARRYGLQSFLCIGADDDDGNNAVRPTNIPAQPITPAKPVTPPATPKAPTVDDRASKAVAKLKAITKLNDVAFLIKAQKDFKATAEGKLLVSGASIEDVVRLNDIDNVLSFYKFVNTTK
jgi:hypothetical protein